MELRLARPCVDDPTRYTAEGNFGCRIAIGMLPQLLGGRVSGLRCSTRLGVAKFELGGWTVMVYQNGRIDIRRVKDMVEAGSVVEEVRALISAAFTCTPAYTARS